MNVKIVGKIGEQKANVSQFNVKLQHSNTDAGFF